MTHSSISSLLLASTALATLALSPAIAQDDAPEVETTPSIELEETEVIVVRGAFIPEPQRETSQIASFLGSDDLARTGDATAAVALSRLSGLSIVSGRFAYIRGLGDRYSSALLNGSPLPSPEPLRRTVPLDLFPSNVLDGADVQKTYSANLPGEFGGGIIDLRTLSQPNENFLNLKIGVGYNTETTGQNGIFVDGGDLDFLGYDDGLRDTPGALADVLNSDQTLNEFDDATIESVGESLVNSPLTRIKSGDIDPNFSASIDGGLNLERGMFDIGLIGVLGFDQEWVTENAIRQTAVNNTVDADFRALETTQNTTVNGLGSVSVGWGSQLVKGTLFYVHTTSNETQITEGTEFNAPSTGNLFIESSGWFERELLFGQLAGEHTLGGLDFSWRGALSESTRDAPYERELERFVFPDGQVLYSEPSRYTIKFTELTDTVASAGADVSYPFAIGDFREAIFSGGVDYATTDREYESLLLRFSGGGGTLPLDVQAARPDLLFTPENIRPGRFELQEIATTEDFYDGELDVFAAYGQADVELLPFIRVTAGLRYEDAEQAVATSDRFGNPGAASTDLINEYYLPSLTFTWNFAEDLQLRLAYSETITRPQFRELAPSQFFDPETDRTYRGNAALVDSELTNFDARLEYYFGRNQFITLAGFYKEIENPIEELQFSTSTSVFETTYINSPKAELFGGEFEVRTLFDSPLEGRWWDNRDWLFSFNYTYTYSEVTASEGDSIFVGFLGGERDASLFGLDGSSLQGSPENIVNMQFGWESDYDQLTLLLGWVDERILQRGILLPGRELPDVIEDPGVQLDLVYRYNFDMFGNAFTLGLAGRNLLDEANEEYQVSDEIGRTEFNTYDRGQSFSVSLSTQF